MDAKISAALEELNGLLQEQQITPFKLGVADPNELKLLEKNARFMTKEVFDALTQGIERLGMSSLPFCWWDGKNYHVLSGNHRVQAARAAGAKAVLFLFTDADLSQEEQITIQLAHNQITGQDDPHILGELWEMLKQPNLKALTGFDDEWFKKLPEVDFSAISGPKIMFKALNLIFLPEDMDRVEEAVEVIQKEAGKSKTFLARYADFKIFFEAVVKVKEGLDILNTATAIRKMAEMSLERLDELQDEGPAAS